MPSFTPQQIEEFLREFFDVVGTRQYIGARYVPLFGRKGEESIEWDGGVAPYEPLTIVTWQGDSYTSRQYVPARVNIDDAEYWARTGNFNGQIEEYRAEVARYASEVEGMLEESKAYTDTKAAELESSKVPLPITDIYGTEGQVLSSNADGTTTWVNPVVPDAEATAAAVDAWLDEHPEATTTVEDNSITNAKIRDDTIRDEKLTPYGVRERLDTVVSTLGGIYAENASYGSNFAYTPDTPDRLVTGLFKMQTIPFTIDAGTGYEFRVLSRDLGLQPLTIGAWVQTVTINRTDRYVQFVVRKTNNAPLSPDEIGDAITTDLSGIHCLIPSGSLWNLSKGIADDVADVQSSLTGLSSGIETASKRLDAITSASGIYVEQASVATNGTYTHGVGTRILTGFIRFTDTPVTLTPSSEYSIRVATYDLSLRYTPIQDWSSTPVTLTRSDRYYRIIVKHGSDLPITPDEFDDAVTISTDGYECLIPSVSLLSEIGDTVTAVGEVNDDLATYMADADLKELKAQYALNMNQTGNYDEVWEFGNWMYPSIVSMDRLRKRLFYTFGTHSACAGIGQYDFETGEHTKTLVKRNTGGQVDDHDIMGIRVLSNGIVLAAYSGGHGNDRRMYVRVGMTPESVDMMGDVTVLESAYFTTYCQIFEYSGRVYMFYRGSNTRWLYRYSTGITREGLTQWSAEQTLVTHGSQMYCSLKETTVPGTLRVCCYTNPSADDTSIRLCFLHLGNMTLYDVDDTTPIGLSSTLSDLTVIVPVPTNGMVNRLFEAAITPPSDNKILFCQFTNSSSSQDGTYYVYDNGTVLPVAPCGTAIWVPKAQNGIVWCGTDKIVLGRGESGSDRIEIYDYDVNTGATLSKVVASNARSQRGTQWYRTARPIVDDHQKVVMFWEGYYNPNSFQDSYPSARIYDIANDEMLM